MATLCMVCYCDLCMVHMVSYCALCMVHQQMRGSSPRTYHIYVMNEGELRNKSLLNSISIIYCESHMYVLINYQKGGD